MTAPSAARAGYYEVLKAIGAKSGAIGHELADAVAGSIERNLGPDERWWAAAIESLRREMEASSDTIDTALSNRRGVTKPACIADVCSRRSKKAPWGELLLLLVRNLRPQTVLELGTCLGISGAYMAAGLALNGHGRLVTIEGAPALADKARENLTDLGLRGEVVAGLFRDTLIEVASELQPVEFALIDGHHDEEATLTYFSQLLPYLDNDAVVVFDDIAWSEGMAQAWMSLRVHERVRMALSLEAIGICLVGNAGAPDGASVFELPTVTRMRSALSSAVKR